MVSYLTHLQQVGDTIETCARKLAYIRHNYGPLISAYSGPTVLDVGPGMGVLISYLQTQRVKAIDALDNDVSVLKHIVRTYPIRHTFRSRSNNLTEIVKGRYDLIFLMQIVEHIPKSAYHSFLYPLYRTLKPGGKMIIMVPNGGNPLNLLERYSDLQHENLFTEFTLTDLPALCGMTHYSLLIEPYRIPPDSLVNSLRILIQSVIHFVMRLLVMGNGGVYQKIMTPNISLIITKEKS